MINSLLIPETKYTPQVSFDDEQNSFTLRGESYIEYPQEFYQPVLSWLKKYLETNYRPFTVNFQVTYFNTSSSAVFIELLKLLVNTQTTRDILVSVDWFVQCGDNEILEAGEMFKIDFPTLAFNVITSSRAAA